MSVEIKAAMIGVRGALLVWIVSWWWSLHRDRRTGKRVHTMLSLEIDENLRALSEWRDEVRKAKSASEWRTKNVNNQNIDAQVEREMVTQAWLKLGVPNWIHRIWWESTQLVPIALDEQEIKEVHRLHRELEAISVRMKQEIPYDMSKVDEVISAGNTLSKRRSENS
jgi:hypothetical protein